MKPVHAAALALALLLAPPALAGEAKPGAPPRLDMPRTLGGAPGLRVDDSMMLYVPARPGRGSTIGVLAVDSETVLSPAAMASIVPEGDPKFGAIVRHGTFSSPKFPGASTFFAEHIADDFFKQTWIMTTGRQNIMVTITAPDTASARQAQAEVAQKVFEGAVISAVAKGE